MRLRNSPTDSNIEKVENDKNFIQMTMLSDFMGNILEDYDIKGVIGRGSYGTVSEAYRKSDGLHVAIKEQELGSNVQYQRYLIRELDILSKIKHPNCLQLIGFTFQPKPIIVTPFMSHGTLEEALKAPYTKNEKYDGFTPTKKMCSLYGICSAMDYLHSKAIVHRDFKPANIFLNDDFDIIIADFGLSRTVQQNADMTMGFVGSPIFMAPELFSGDYESVTNAIDVYSFGVTLLFYFTNKVEKLDDNPRLAITKNFYIRLSKGARPAAPPMPDAYSDLYKELVKEDPNGRPTFKELAERFETDPKYLLPDVNIEEYKAYIEKIKIENERIQSSSSAESLSLSMSSTLSSTSSSSSLKRNPKKHKRY